MAKILQVEDNEMNRDTLSRRLMRKGHDVVVGEDGQKGLEMATGEGPDIILMDMSLPVFDGWRGSPSLPRHEDVKGYGVRPFSRAASRPPPT